MVTGVTNRNVSLQSAGLRPDPKHSLLCPVATYVQFVYLLAY